MSLRRVFGPTRESYIFCYFLPSWTGETEKRARLNAEKRVKRRALKPEELPEPPMRCVECGSYRTQIRKGCLGHPFGGPVWHRLGDRESAGGLYHCGNCSERLRKRRIRLATRLLKAQAKARTNLVHTATQDVRRLPSSSPQVS